MSIDKSLKKAGGMGRARNVLTRPERMALLQEDEKWVPEKGVYNLPEDQVPAARPRASRAPSGSRPKA